MSDLNATGYRSCRKLVLFPLLVVIVSAGCGGTSQRQPDCSVAVGLGVAPNNATADHAAAPPGNKVPFVASDTLPVGCIPTPGPIRFDLKWSVSDTVNTKIGNTPNVDYGVATCINATPAPVTVTATGANRLGNTITGTAILACK
jgi:hypothetical protein